MSEQKKARAELLRIGRLLHQRGFIAATEGNLSVRLASGDLLVTPTGVCKGMMQARDLVLVDSAGRRRSRQPSRRNASSEVGMHLLIYRLRPDVHAIVHAHPPTATGFAVAGIALEQALLPEVIVGLGGIPLAPYATPGTPELSETLEPLVRAHDAVLMANHGVVTCGPDLERAYLNMETVEHFARIALAAKMAGEPQPLPGSEVERLREMRTAYFANAKPLTKKRG